MGRLSISPAQRLGHRQGAVRHAARVGGLAVDRLGVVDPGADAVCLEVRPQPVALGRTGHVEVKDVLSARVREGQLERKAGKELGVGRGVPAAGLRSTRRAVRA